MGHLLGYFQDVAEKHWAEELPQSVGVRHAVLEDAPAYSQSGWATGISAGPLLLCAAEVDSH